MSDFSVNQPAAPMPDEEQLADDAHLSEEGEDNPFWAAYDDNQSHRERVGGWAHADGAGGAGE